jgi:RNA polymerase sigma factor (sigma-70 family)
MYRPHKGNAMTTGKTSELFRQLGGKEMLPHGTGLSDAQLLEGFVARREEAALAAIVRRHGPMVWGVCRRVLGNYHDAEDAFQATFLVLVRKAASIAAPDLLANWLYGVAHQTALKARATTAKRSARERQVMEMPEPAVPEQDLWAELEPLLDQELGRLPTRYRTAIVLCDLEGKTRKEAAGQLGVPDGTLAAWVARGRGMLARRLARHRLLLSGEALAAVLLQNAASAGVPVSVMASTMTATRLFASAPAAATGAISAKAAALADQVVKAMLVSKLKLGMAVLAIVALLGAAVGASASHMMGQAPADPKAQAPPTAGKSAGEQNPLPDGLRTPPPPEERRVAVPERDRDEEYPKLSPYPAIRWPTPPPEVWIDGQWHVLRSIDGIAVEKLFEFARKKYRGSWQEHFGEDLVQILTEMGHKPGKTVKLVVSDPRTGKEKTLENVAMTEENRRSVRDQEEGQLPVFALTPDHLRQALEEFKSALDRRWSYRHANGAAFDAAVAALRKKIDDGLSPGDFGVELQKIIALGIDGHAGESTHSLPSAGYLPFLVEPEGDRFAAFMPDRSGFVAPGFPYLTKIDGKDVAEWCSAASVLVPKGSPQYVRRHCLRHLRDLDYLRGLMKLPRKETVEVELSAGDGRASKTLTLPLARSSGIYGEWPRGGSRLLAGNIGYLRLPDMLRTTSVSEIRKWMPQFKGTAGLIIDVRDNGGGDRDALPLLYSYLADPAEPPRVFTAAAYRLHKEHPDNHLSQRFMYRADAAEWTEAERRAVAAFARTFKPQWKLPKGQFSDWHYMALSRLDDPDIYHYRMPVVVLMNAKCFSATDVFLAGLKGMKNVTLLGTPSGGGSAMANQVSLGETPFRIRIGTMASFQADGKLFDGNGVRPDVVVEAVPEYHVGGRDNVLEEAVRRIKGR